MTENFGSPRERAEVSFELGTGFFSEFIHRQMTLCEAAGMERTALTLQAKLLPGRPMLTKLHIPSFPSFLLAGQLLELPLTGKANIIVL